MTGTRSTKLEHPGSRTTVGVPEVRVRRANGAAVRPERRWVLYWMIAARRARSNFALQRAVEHARALGRPLVVLEALRCGYPHASDRFHAFVLAGMRDNARELARAGVTHHAYVEPRAGAGAGLLERLARDACVVVTDEYPAFFLPRMVRVAAARLDVALEVVDSNGLHPLRATERAFPTAHSFRRWYQKHAPEFLASFPEPDPLAGAKLPRLRALPPDVLRRWPRASEALLAGDLRALAKLPIDHCVVPTRLRGGSTAGRARLHAFVRDKLADYAEQRNEPDADASSGLSPYLHFGHVGAHEVFAAVARAESWSPGDLAARTDGARTGFWNMSAGAEAFLDQLLVWRELGYNFCTHHPRDMARYESLPAFALKTLAKHAGDPRPEVYTLRELEEARTADALWNAAQTELVRDGRIHNYLRMLWGKKILEWSPSPRRALAVMLHLNDKYALDGRDPNSLSGIFWCLGRYDRPWGPERPIFGTVRYMSSANTARKLGLREYVARHAERAATPASRTA